MKQPVLLGMNRNDPEYEVLDPTVGSGKNLADIIGLDAFSIFERSNVLDSRVWRREDARKRAQFVKAMMYGRVVVVLGNEAWQTLSLPRCRWLESVIHDGVLWIRVPHPSGLNHWYNDEKNKDKVRHLFLEIDRIVGGAIEDSPEKTRVAWPNIRG